MAILRLIIFRLLVILFSYIATCQMIKLLRYAVK